MYCEEHGTAVRIQKCMCADVLCFKNYIYIYFTCIVALGRDARLIVIIAGSPKETAREDCPERARGAVGESGLPPTFA
jgi:hypothetical protein